MIPEVGQYFYDGRGDFCQMIDNIHYKSIALNLPLIYVEGSELFSCKRLATHEDEYINTIGSNDIMNTEFNVTLENGHDTVKGLKALEKQYIEHVYRVSRYNQSKAARNLGLSRGCLRMKLKEYFGDQYL